MEYPFFDFLKYWPKHFKKNIEQKYGHSHFKSALGINFQLWEVVKLKRHKYVHLCIFCLTTSWSQKLISKTDLKRECPYFYSIFFLKFWSVFKKVKKWISNCIGKKWFDRRRVFFWNFYFWKSQTPQNMPEFGWWHAGSSNQTVPANPFLYSFALANSLSRDWGYWPSQHAEWSSTICGKSVMQSWDN